MSAAEEFHHLPSMHQTGYLHPGYAQAFSEFAVPTALPRSGAWFLKRAIPGSGDFDGIGCYPYLACQDWSALASDLAAIESDLVSIAAAPDPFGDYTRPDLERAFPDFMIHFKDHYVADLSRSHDTIVSRHHRRSVEKALRSVDVECCAEPLQFLDDVERLFEHTVHKFKITGIRAYSRDSLARQLALPGCFASLARHKGKVVAAHIQMAHGQTVYAHLACTGRDADGLGAAYALYDAEIRYFADKARWLDWGGEPGAAAATGALGSFKRGWSTDIRPAYFCGRILDRDRYDRVVRDRGIQSQRYFPAYREGEFR